MSEPQIAIDKVSHVYRPPRGRPVLALEEVSLSVQPLFGAARAIGLRQVHIALSDRRFPADRDRHDRGERRTGEGAGPRPRHRVSAFRAVSVEVRARQHPLRPGTPSHAQGRSAGPGAALHRSRGAFGIFRGQLPLAAFRRHEAAHRARPHARLRPEHPADGRAVRRARRADTAPDAGGTAAASAAHAEDRDLRHPRCAGGGLSRRPRRRDVGAARPHQDHRRHQIRQERSAPFKTKGFVDKVDELWNLVRDEAIKAERHKP